MKYLKLAMLAAGMIVGIGSAHASKSIGSDPNAVGGVQLPCEAKVAGTKVAGVLAPGGHSARTSKPTTVQSRSSSVAQ